MISAGEQAEHIENCLATVQVVIVISLFGTCLSQIVASASDAYYIHGHAGPDKRCALFAKHLCNLGIATAFFSHA